jgi:hypothetical protein
MNREDEKRERMKRGRTEKARRFRVMAAALLTTQLLTCSLLLAPARAQPTQEEVFRSIGENVNEPVDSGRVLGVLAGMAGVILLVAVIGQQRKRVAAPKPLHHHGKLLKEVLGSITVKSAELKQLKTIVQEAKVRGGHGIPESPLTLLLCPSLLARAVKENPGKVDRPVVAGLVRRLVGR